MSTRVTKRIFNIDIKNYTKDNLEENGIYIHFDECDITDASILIIGPEDTPYENGYYIFKVKFTDEYPYKPPIVKFLSNSKVRIHPNLYVNGKVCLSILGTWAGPSWTSVMDINAVAKSIQSIMSKKAIQNEPGFSSEDGELCRNYDRIVWFENIRSYILSMQEKQHNTFTDLIRTHFVENIDTNRKKIKNNTRYGMPEVELKIQPYTISLVENITNLEKLFNKIEINIKLKLYK